jgi:hypothetical protein
MKCCHVKQTNGYIEFAPYVNDTEDVETSENKMDVLNESRVGLIDVQQE